MRSIATPETAPRRDAIEQALRARIADLLPNDALPSEAELSKEFGVSRMTARAAVMRLVADGLVYRESGRGTFVARAPLPRRADTLVRFSEEMRRQGRTPSSKVVGAQLRRPTSSETDRLRLKRGAEVVSITRVRLGDGIPIALERGVFPGSLAPLLEHDLASRSLHEVLACLGYVPSFGQASIMASNVTDLEAELLAVVPGAALLVEQRLIFDQHENPLEFTQSKYVGERYMLGVTFEVQRVDRG